MVLYNEINVYMFGYYSLPLRGQCFNNHCSLCSAALKCLTSVSLNSETLPVSNFNMGLINRISWEK